MHANEFKHNPDGTTHIYLYKNTGRLAGKYVAIIDTVDWERVKNLRWRVDIKDRGPHRRPGGPYAHTNILHPDGTLIERTDQPGNKRPRQTALFLHHLILGKPKKDMVYDHINHNGLDNRKANLRQVTHAENMRNKRKTKSPTTSKYKGVCWLSREKRWFSSIALDGKEKSLGYFNCEICAAAAYDKQAQKSWGDIAYLNDVQACTKSDCKSTREGENYSGYSGVYKSKPGDKKWSARISYRRKRYYLGRYSTKEEAARVRDLKALEFFGKSAKLNFPIEDYK
jgi:hypothetical protein